MSALPDYAEALELALRSVRPIARTEIVPLRDCARRILAELIVADRDLPPFNRAQMDGYALRAAEYAPGKPFQVVATIPAGAAANVSAPARCCVAIATGAPLPSDVDAVIQHELSDRDKAPRLSEPGVSAAQTHVRFTIDSINAGQNVHPCGADARTGDLLVPAKTLLGAQHLGIAAAVGRSSLKVVSRPRAVILTSGDEVVPVEAKVQPHQIRDSNEPMLREVLSRIGADVIESAHLVDERDSTINAVRAAIESSDLLITVGGVSAGERDHFPLAYEACGVTLDLKGASIQPGRPIVVGRAASGCVVIGLPGNPVSALACACLFAWPIVRAMLGVDSALAWREVTIAEPVKPNPNRRAFRPAILRDDGAAIVPEWAGSGDLVHTSPTHGLLELPVQREPVASRTTIRFLPWP